MSTRRDSRTDEQRQADEQREREFHRQREEAGLPVLNFAGIIQLTFRDITDEEVERLHGKLIDAAYMILAEPEFSREPRDPRKAHYSGSTFKCEPPLEAS